MIPLSSLPLQQKTILDRILNNKVISKHSLEEFKEYLVRRLREGPTRTQKTILFTFLGIVLVYAMWKQRIATLSLFREFAEQCQDYEENLRKSPRTPRTPRTPRASSMLSKHKKHLTECDTFLQNESWNVVMNGELFHEYRTSLHSLVHRRRQESPDLSQVLKVNAKVQTVLAEQIHWLSWSERFTEYLSHVKHRVVQFVWKQEK